MTDEIEYKYLNLHNSMNIEYKYKRTLPFDSMINLLQSYNNCFHVVSHLVGVPYNINLRRYETLHT